MIPDLLVRITAPRARGNGSQGATEAALVSAGTMGDPVRGQHDLPVMLAPLPADFIKCE
jgi:hypothetical protein